MHSHGEPQLPRPISHIYIRGCSQGVQEALLAGMPVHEGEVLSDELLQNALRAAKAVDGRLEVFVSRALPSQAYDGLPERLRSRLKAPACDDGVNVTIYDPASLPRRIRVEGEVQESMLIAGVTPSGDGVVRLGIVVGRDGTVIEVQPLTGPESLIGPAMDAVRRWTYRPTLLNGLPVEVQTVIQMSLPPK